MTKTNLQAVYPQAFSTAKSSAGAGVYLNNPPARKLAEFFEAKGLPALKKEDQTEQWYADWLGYQADHHLYATILSPKRYSTLGAEFDLLNYARFMELFAYFSPAHAYSLQCTFLGFFSVLLGTNADLKQEAVKLLEAGGLFALGVSERDHGSDLMGNEFSVREDSPEHWIASGKKYYIGNSNVASMISILARKKSKSVAGRERRAPFILFALRPKQSKGYRNVRKIGTLGIRSAFVGELEVKDHELPKGDLVAEGRGAWDAVLGTVTLGKFFLGFGSIGICEHAFQEAAQHLTMRILYGKPVVAMPHIQAASTQAYVRLAAMKLYAYRALDYVHASTATDRRYLLFTAVQKAKVSTEGVKVMALLSECIGAKGFESDTYFETALRDAQLIPGLEGSMHINLGLTAQFIPRYFDHPDAASSLPASLLTGAAAGENTDLTEARGGPISTIGFAEFDRAYESLNSVRNVQIFAAQAKAFHRFLHGRDAAEALVDLMTDSETAMAVGHCMATIAYAQLIAENATLGEIPAQMIATVFHLLVADLSMLALTLASVRRLDPSRRALARRMIVIPKTTPEDWEFVSNQWLATIAPMTTMAT